MTNDESPHLGDVRGAWAGRLRGTLFVIRHLSLVILPLLALITLAGCGGDFMTSTPVFARFTVGSVLREFKAQGLRADGDQPLPKDGQWATAPRYSEARSFLAGKGNGVPATVFSFDSPGDQEALTDYLKQKYAGHYRLIANENIVLVFWVPDSADTTTYDAALLAMR